MTLAREMALESEYVMGTFDRKPVERKSRGAA